MRKFFFGNVLASYRVRVDYLQKQVAEELGISKRTLQDWESGRRLPPNLMEVLSRITNLFQLDQGETDLLYRAVDQASPLIPHVPSQYRFLREFSFGRLLASYRVRAGFTQKQVIDYLNDKLKQKESKVTERTYQSWEGKKAIPYKNKIEVLQYITNLFELDKLETDQLYRTAAQFPPEIQNLPFPPNAYFTGRDIYLAQLDRFFKTGKTVALTQPIGISGLGGIGKTQLALEYAHRCYPKAYRTVLWVNASNKATLETSYLSIAQRLKLSEQNEREIDLIVQAVKTWLEEHSGWLLVLDNADDLQLARNFLPTEPHGRILLTTRSQFLGNIAAPIVLEAMEPEEGLHFLLRRSGVLGLETEPETLALTIREAAAQLVDLLGRHPLALDQAGAYIEETGASFNDYLRLYREQRRILLKKRGLLGDEHPESVVVTFEVCFQRASTLCSSAAGVLSFCAFLHPDAIPEEIFSHVEHLKLSPLAFNDAIRALRRYSLIKRNAQDKLLSVHRLVQAVRKDGMDKETHPEWAERAVLAVNAAFPVVKFNNWSFCDRLLPHALVCWDLIKQHHLFSGETSALLKNMGWYLMERERYAEAEPVLRQALAIREQQLGPQHSDTATSFNDLAELYWRQGRYTEAEPLVQHALTIRKQQFGLSHPDTATSLNDLAVLYDEQGKYAEAEPLFERALDIREQQLGPEHRDTAQSLNNLAYCNKAQGKYEQAERLYMRALDIKEQQLGPQHPETATCLNNLARLYDAQGKYEQAEPLYQRALEISEQQLGPEHRDTAQSLNNLAYYNKARGKYEQAERLYQRALRIWEQQLGAEHPETATCLNNLAVLYDEQGKYAEAEPLFERALAIREQQLGPEHPNVASSLNGLAELYREQGRYAEAELLYQRALLIREQALGKHHPKTTETRVRFITLLHAMGQHEEAAQLDAVQRESVETKNEETANQDESQCRRKPQASADESQK
jgi:tetratricopeptide (TPR) repeat protein